MRNPDLALVDGYSRQVAHLDVEITRLEAQLDYLRRTKGEVIERLLEARSKAGETR